MTERPRIADTSSAPTNRPKASRSGLRAALKLVSLTLFSCYAVLLPVFGTAALVLLLSAETFRGRAFAVCAMCMILLPVSVVLGSRWPGRRWWRYLPAGVFLLGAFSLGIALLALAPTGKTMDGSEVGSYWPEEPGYPRYSPLNLLPERDQVKLGNYLLGSTGLVLPADQADRVREMTMPLYRQMDQREEYAQLGSAMHYVWTDALGSETGSGHFYYCVPQHTPGERLPLVLFVHGSAGNFRAYLYFWQKFCEQFRCVVVCPTFGSGDWKQPGGVETIERARAHAIENFPIDQQQVFLVGLSNGGLGVSRTARDHPEHYRGLIFVSSVLESRIISSPEFIAGWKDHPVLIIHGAHDRRIPQSVAEEANATLNQIGSQATFRVYPDEDHFLMFGSRERVYRDIASWIGQMESKESRIRSERAQQ